MTNPIKTYYENNDSLFSTKWSTYFDIYWEHMSKFMNYDKPKIMEIGVRHGGSLMCYKKIFEKSEIFGVDMNPNYKQLEKYGFKIYIGKQDNVGFLNTLPSFDCIIDDGSHITKDILISFRTLFPKMEYGGVYIIEDLHENSNPDFTIEKLKLNINDIKAIYFYHKICVIYKREKNEIVNNIYYKEDLTDYKPTVVFSGVTKID